MTYFEGFIVPVPGSAKAAYLDHSNAFSPMLSGLGVQRMVENWGVDVPEGKVTDFRKAVNAKPDETIVVSWFEYPDRAARDAANAKMMSDPRMEELGGNAPFDGSRMIMGGFEAIVDEGSGGGTFTDAIVIPVPESKRDAYRDRAAKMAKVFLQYGAVRVAEAVADDVDHGKVTDFYRAVKAEDGETIVMSFIEWPDKATRDQAWGRIMEDESLRPEGEPPFAGQRMFWGGFDKIADSSRQA